MGNKLSCSCGQPQPRKGYKCEDAPMSKQQQNLQITGAHLTNLTPQQIALQQQQSAHRREGQLLKLWAEVFHVSNAPVGGVFWKRLSEDLVPVNISCIKDTSTSCQFQITAYNTMVDKVLDVRLNQPGTKLGQASECFVYWKGDTGDTWGLNFTSAVDARNFKQLCSPQFKIARKASSSYSIKDQQQLQQQNKKQQLIQNQQQSALATKRKPQSTPSSPSTRRREQLAALNQMSSTGHYPPEILAAASQQYCTCMADTVVNRQQRNGRNVRYAASSTLPKSMFRQDGRLIAYPSQNNLMPVTSKQSSAGQQQQLTNKQMMQKQMLQSGPIRSRPNTQPMLTKSQLAAQQKIAFQHRAACAGGPEKSTPGTMQVCDVRCKSKSSDDVRKSVSTGTEDLLMESRSALTEKNTLLNTSQNARRLHPMMPATKTTIQQTMQPSKVSGYQSDHTGLQTRRTMQTTGTNTTCTIPNCSLAHRSKMDAFSQQAHPRPTSVPNWNFGTSEDNADVDVRSRPFRSETGRRRSLERTACVDYTDQSPPSDTYMLENLRKMFQQQQNIQTKQTNGNINVTTPSSTSGDEAAAAIAIANLVKQSGNRKTIQQNLNALLGNKLAGKLINNMALAQLSKQNSAEQPPGLASQQQASTTSSSLAKQTSGQQQSTPGTTSPTIKKLQEYETHLRNMLARGNSTELENFSLNTLEALVSQSLENVVSLMKEVQSELDAIQLEEQQYRAEQAESQQKSNQPQQISAQDFQSFSQLGNKNDKHYWSRSYTLPSRHSLPAPLNVNKPQSVTGISPSARLATSNLSSMNAGSLGFGLNMSGLLSGNDRNEMFREMKKRSSTPFLDAISMDNLAYLTGGWNNAGQSFESNDSRANLTWSEVSDEEEIAISDEDADLLATAHSFAESPFRQAKLNATLQCIGAVRKAGFLMVKKWLLRKPNSNTGANIELARKRGWKSYWTCLKGTTLLFYQCDNNGPVSFDSKPKHLIILDGSLVLPLPEHPKKENVFCLSTCFGDGYLFQAPCQLELDNWTTQIHCSCGASFARHRGKSGTVHLLEEEINKLQKKLEHEAKLKHMSELQISVASDMETKRSLQSQIRVYEQHFEQYFIDQFRLRSYVASILEQEQPNGKSLLARSERILNSVMNSGRASASLRKRQSSGQLSRHSSIGSRPSSAAGYGQISTPSTDLIITVQIIYPNEELPIPVKISALDTVEDLLYQVCNDRQLTPSDHYLQCKRIVDGERYVPHRTEVIKQHHLEVDLWRVCQKTLYQVELCRNSLDQLFGFSVEAELVESTSTTGNTNQLNTNQQTANTNLDSSQVPCSTITPTSAQTPTGYDELCVYVSRVEEDKLAAYQGISRGDEIMVINGNIVSELDMMYIESVLQEELSLCMMLRSCKDLSQTDVANQFGLGAELDALAGLQTSDDYIESLVCPPPPSDILHPFTDIEIGKLIAPPPNHNSTSPRSRNLLKDNITNTNQLLHDTFLGQSQDSQWPDSQPSFGDCQLLQDNQQSSLGYGRKLNTNLPVDLMFGTGSLDQVEPLPAEDELSADLDCGGQTQLSEIERLKKAIHELVDTEKSYVNHLNNLVQLYLEPMQQLNLLSNCEVLTLFYNIQDIIAFQRQLLDQINQVLQRNFDYPNFTTQSQFSTLLCDLASVFLNAENAERFKLYCKFCANHSKAMKTLYTDCNSNHKLIEFLTNSCKGEHASSLESYLIKPIQRILKYPLLLQQISLFSQPESSERKQLSFALQAMEDVAYKLNEMQKIHEEYGAIFDHLSRQHLKATKQQVQLSTSELNHYGEVQWQNIPEFLGKMKKNLDLYAVCFVFKSAVVFLCKEKIRQKKKLVPNMNKSNEVEIIRYQVLMPVNEVQVRATTVKNDSSTAIDSDTGNVTRSLYNWELIHLKCSQSGATQRRTEKVYQLANTTNDERNAFLHHIRQIIRESVRKMGLPSSKLNSTTTNGNYQTLHTLAKHQLLTAVAATGTQLNSIQSSTDRPSLADMKASTSTQSRDSIDLNEPKNETTTAQRTVTISTTITKQKPPAPHPLQKQASSSSGDFPPPPDSKKVPPKPPTRHLPAESATVAKRPVQRHFLSKSNTGRTFEKQQTIDEKSSPPLGT